MFNPGGDKLNDKHKSISSHGHDDNTAVSNHHDSSNSPLSDLVAHSISFNIIFNPGGSTLDNNGVDSEHNAISNADTGNTFIYDTGGRNINSNLVFNPSSNSFVYDPGSTSSSNTLDGGTTTIITSNQGDHVFDPSSFNFHSSGDLQSLRVIGLLFASLYMVSLTRIPMIGLRFVLLIGLGLSLPWTV
jgi:hypothetical protein